MNRDIVIHPILLVIYVVLFLFAHNFGEFSFQEMWMPLFVCIGFTLGLWVILRLILKSWQKSGIIVSLFLFLFFSYDHARTYLEAKVTIGLMSLVWILSFVVGFYLTVKWKGFLRKGTQILNVFSIVLVLFPLANIAYLSAEGCGASQQTASGPANEIEVTGENKEYPDVYFIILDAYGREDILRELYDYNNSYFIGYLRGKDFYVADQATSNYCQTGLSIGSCFNMSYLDEWVKAVGINTSGGNAPLTGLIDQGHVIRYLKKRGYQIITFGPSRPEVRLPSADIHLQAGISIAFLNALINLTPLPDILWNRTEGGIFDMYREHLLYILDSLGEIYKLGDAPKFVVAHIESPHSPFVFGPNGEPIKLESRLNDQDGNWLIRPGRLTLEEYRSHYRDQIIFLNSKVKTMVDQILANSSRPPIILILGDHGPRSGVIWDSVKKTDVRECMSILSAYYLPGSGDEHLYSEISPVNIFRVILNHYFGQQYELLPDQCFFSTAGRLYQFHDVTDRVRGTKRFSGGI